jgi:acetylornithine/LysW-gamma-L-lysine aminotransferase
MLPGFRHVPFDDLDALEAAMDDTVAAVIVEPIQGEAGVRVPADGYLAGVRERCTARGALLILDEIQTAFRTGALFAFTRASIVPDILCLSKGIANGLPMGVTVTTEEVGERVPKGSHGSTFAGNPLVCAAGAATLKVLANPELHRRAEWLGATFLERLRALQRPEIREARGRGLMVALELKRPSTALIKALQDRGVLTLPAGATGIRFLPSVLIDARQLDEAIDVLTGAMSDTADHRHL